MTRSVMSNLNQTSSQILILKLSLLLSFICLLGNNKANAQQVGVNGDFQLAHTAGCAPFTVRPELLFAVTTEPVLYYYENTLDPNDCSENINQNPSACVDVAATADTQFTFNTPGVYYIVQTIGTIPTPRVDYIKVTVFEDRAPFVGISTCSNNEALFVFDFSGDFFDYYDIDFGDGTTMQYQKTGSNIFTHTYPQSGTYPITIEGQLVTGDNASCDLIRREEIITFDRIPEPTIDSLIIENDIEANIYYQPLNELLVYNLEIDRGNGFEFFQPLPTQANPNGFLIRDVSLDFRNESYRFRIEATDNCGSASVFAEPISSIAFNSDLSAFNNGIEVGLVWEISSIGFNALDYFIGGIFDQTFNTPTNSNNFTVSFNSCVDFEELFLEHIFNGKLSRSIRLIPFEGENLELPPIPPPDADLSGLGIVLNFQSPLFPANSYQILRRNQAGVFEQIGTSTNNTFTDSAVPTGIAQACYAIRYVDACGNISETSPETCITVSGLIRVPSAFSPNADGVNDTFSVGEGIFVSFDMTIYNRWGTIVFRSNNPNAGWQGTYDGKPAPIGTYTYRISFKNADNVPISKTGTFILIR
ncbi:gliding motility-associated C-terminal domain-containing protein [Roseivirga sp.]|uniref:T9SS type B sorting domain-containing protein n=1 Tax=Roseivirga sp. TaxID=1964215 RepID=UPI003B8BD1E1